MSNYPVYVSPDGKNEQVAATPVRQVQLKHAGWKLKKTTTPAAASRRQTAQKDDAAETPAGE